MPTRAFSDVDVASRALVMIGTKPITSFGDGTTEATAAATIYEDVVTQVLTTTRWRFAMAEVELQMLTEVPLVKWKAAYQLPSDTLSISALRANNTDIPFDRYQDKIYCDQINTAPVYLDYVRRVDTADWPPYFTLPVIHLLASELAIAVAQNEQLSALHAEKYEVFASRGRTTDSQGRTNSVLHLKRYEKARR